MLPCVIVSPGTNIPTQSTSWSTLLETSVKGHLLLVASLAGFSHFLQLVSLNVMDTFLQVPKVVPDSHYVYLNISYLSVNF